MATETVRVDFINDLAFVTINNPPVNATSNAVRTKLDEAVRQVAISGAKAAIIRCEGRTFVAGGDITEFDRPPMEPQLPDVCDAIEACPVPFIAAMHGTVLGGGFEIALACAWRVALKETKFGLPEVNIGLIPGAGGTQRLPRLVGVEEAVKIACSGAMFPAAKMLEAGVLDAMVDNLSDAVLAFAKNLPPRPTGISQRDINSPGKDWFDGQRLSLKKSAKGQQSPLHALEAIEWATQTPFADGLMRERERFMLLKNSAESKALRHAFFAERKAAKPDAIEAGKPTPIEKIAVIGGGLMGAGISVAMLGAGYQVLMIERDEAAAQGGAARVRDIIEGSVERGKLSETAMQEQLAKFSASADYGDCADADLAIEAVFEDLAIKREVFQKLNKVMSPKAILATNTSYLDPGAIFAGVSNPERCLGLHFFSPAHVMKLLEIVKTAQTSPDTLATGFEIAKKTRKIAVLSGICDGFIGNRILAAYRRQADYMLADGALPYQIDAAMRDFGMPMGPYELQDLTGLQIAWATRKRQAKTRDPAQRYVTLGDQLCEMERFGQRSARGWYLYENGKREPIRDAEVEDLIQKYSAELGIVRQDFSKETIQNRLIAAMANEGALIAEEGIAESRDDVDVVKLHGYGFPRWRGGPMHYVKMTGLAQFGKHMQDVMAQSPKSWQLSKWLA